jgi:hypothetical protein
VISPGTVEHQSSSDLCVMYHWGRVKNMGAFSVGKCVTKSSWLTTFLMNHYNHGRYNSDFDAWCLWLQDTFYRIQLEYNLNLALCLGSFAISKNAKSSWGFGRSFCSPTWNFLLVRITELLALNLESSSGFLMILELREWIYMLNI